MKTNPSSSKPTRAAKQKTGGGWMRRLVVRLRSGWLPWYLRWPVMLAQVALLPILLPLEFLWLVWERGGSVAWEISIDGIRDMPGDFWACWTGERRLWDYSHNVKVVAPQPAGASDETGVDP